MRTFPVLFVAPCVTYGYGSVILLELQCMLSDHTSYRLFWLKLVQPLTFRTKLHQFSFNGDYLSSNVTVTQSRRFVALPLSSAASRCETASSSLSVSIRCAN